MSSGVGSLLNKTRLSRRLRSDRTDYLFVEAGGFNEKNPMGWESPLLVMKEDAK